jgi:hypothetical protein
LIFDCRARPTIAAGRNATKRFASEALLDRIAREPREGAGEARAVLPAHRQDRAELDSRCRKTLPFSSFAPSRSEARMRCPGRGNRKEFGESLDDAEDEGVEQRIELHSGVL